MSQYQHISHLQAAVSVDSLSLKEAWKQERPHDASVLSMYKQSSGIIWVAKLLSFQPPKRTNSLLFTVGTIISLEIRNQKDMINDEDTNFYVNTIYRYPVRSRTGQYHLPMHVRMRNCSVCPIELLESMGSDGDGDAGGGDVYAGGGDAAKR